MLSETKIAWLAGLIDGEGCIAFARRRDYVKRNMVRYDVKLAMACQETVRYAYDLIVQIVGDDCVKTPYEERRRVARRRPLWRLEVSSKVGVHDLLITLRPYLVTKCLEAELCIQYLERAMTNKHYRADERDHLLADLATGIRNGCGEARAEAQRVLSQVIPSQASCDPIATMGVKEEGVETSRVSSNNNPDQECPAPVRAGEDIVRSNGKPLASA